MEEIKGGVSTAEGFASAGIACGLKSEDKKDLALIYSRCPADTAAVFTTNQVQAAPVTISREYIRNGKARGIIINSGNANACTGERGLNDTRRMAGLVSRELKLKPEDVLVASTGIIGKYLPMNKIEKGIKEIIPRLNYKEDRPAAEAILTTDKKIKRYSFSFKLPLQETEVKIGGIVKGSGMIHPNMATMLAFVTTDIAIDNKLLEQALGETVEISFNQISVDGDQSTNDSVFIMANGEAGNKIITEKNEDYYKFVKVLKELMIYLAKSIVRDGEGASKFITIKVNKAKTEKEAEKMARMIANSNLVKTACFGEDPNWGRILAAMGASGVDFVPEDVIIRINGRELFKNGLPAAFGEKLDGLLSDNDIDIDVDLNNGDKRNEFWTSDLSYKYVEINAEYHT